MAQYGLVFRSERTTGRNLYTNKKIFDIHSQNIDAKKYCIRKIFTMLLQEPTRNTRQRDYKNTTIIRRSSKPSDIVKDLNVYIKYVPL